MNDAKWNLQQITHTCIRAYTQTPKENTKHKTTATNTNFMFQRLCICIIVRRNKNTSAQRWRILKSPLGRHHTTTNKYIWQRINTSTCTNWGCSHKLHCIYPLLYDSVCVKLISFRSNDVYAAITIWLTHLLASIATTAACYYWRWCWCCCQSWFAAIIWQNS